MKARTGSKVFHVRLNARFPQTSLLSMWFMSLIAIWTRHQLIWRSDVIFRFRCYYIVILPFLYTLWLCIMLWLVRHEYIYIYIYICIYIYIYIFIYSFIYSNMFIYIHISVFVCKCMCMKKLNTKYQGLSLVQNLLTSLIRKSLSFWYGFDILMMFSLFWYMVKKNWKSS